MNNKLTTAGSNDMIDVSEEGELRFWARKFSITPEKLKSAVRAVGSSVTALSNYLNKKLS